MFPLIFFSTQILWRVFRRWSQVCVTLAHFADDS